MEERLTHILVECPELIASVRVGVLNVLDPLEKQGLCEVKFLETRNIRKADLIWCDIFVCVRGSEELTMHIVCEVKRLGRLLLFFLDDDLLHLPKESLAYAYFEYGNHQHALKKILSISDGLWGANNLIRDQYLPLCGGGKWISTRMPTVIKPPPMEERERTVVQVLYAGSVDHQNLIREILSPAIRIVSKQFGDQIQFTFVGPDPALKDIPQVTHQAFFENYDQYREFVEKGSFQIGLAPTKLGHFFQCKYYNKFVEYTAVGAVGIYTDCPLYQQVVQNKKNGLLCQNSPQAWADAIITLAKDQDLRCVCYQNASNLLKSQFAPQNVANQFLMQFPEIRDFRAPVYRIDQVRLYHPLLYFYMDRSRYLFHTYHILAIPIIAWKAVKKLIKWTIGRLSC